jgi:diguanylate cyclase (GGDEF)-like protein/PAS domain S-box-containing protein
MPTSENTYGKFSDSLLRIVKGAALYSGDPQKSFREITEAATNTIGIERASIWMYAADRSSIKSMDLYQFSQGEHSMDAVLSKEDFPNYFAAMNEDRVIDANDAHLDPRTREFSEVYLSPLGVASMLDAPIRFGGQTIGVICLEHVGKPRNWTSDETIYAGSLADLVSHAVEAHKRSKAETALLESQSEVDSNRARFLTIFESAPIGILLVDARTDIIIEMNQAYCDLVGRNKETVHRVGWQSYTHDEDIADEIRHVVELNRGNVGEYKIVKRFIRPDGSVVTAQSKAVAMQNDSCDSDQQYLITLEDITEQRKMNAELSYQASHDALTGLINRNEFEKRVNRILSMTMKAGSEHAMCFLDLDQFKVINDSCGHSAGDELLRQLSQLLQCVIRKRDTIARLGGDEFGVLLEHCALDHANRIANEILKAIKEFQFIWDGQLFRVGASIGLIAITESTGNFSDLFKQADAACYLAKDLGRNRIHVYRPDDAELVVRSGEMQWIGRITQALEEGRFCLYAQPIVALDGSSHRHYELLVRMLDEKGGIILPGSFLPTAERYSLIEKLDAWVVNHACTCLAENPTFVDQIAFVTINLSGPSLTNKGFLESIFRIFKDTGVSPEKVCFEVTETVAISNLDSAIGFIQKLKEVGCHFALDDFGSGISSFGYLKNLPVDYLKIDGIFVKDIVDDPIDFAMVKSINEIGQVMGMKTIAEFVENDEIILKLRTIGVNYGQGYGLGKPVPLIDLITQYELT